MHLKSRLRNTDQYLFQILLREKRTNIYLIGSFLRYMVFKRLNADISKLLVEHISTTNIQSLFLMQREYELNENAD